MNKENMELIARKKCAELGIECDDSVNRCIEKVNRCLRMYRQMQYPSMMRLFGRWMLL